jgi:hypothetical protein
MPVLWIHPKADAEHQRADGAVAGALVAHQEEQCRGKAAEDQQERDGNDDAHGRLKVWE